MIPYGRQSIDDDDIAAVVAVLKGDTLTRGPAVDEFERRLAETVEAEHAVAFANGTAALHAALAVAGVGEGDTVATSSLSFAASAACAVYVGATHRYVDVEPDTLNLDPLLVPDDCTALVAVHYAGLPVDLTRLGRRPPLVVEDAAQALGARTPDGPVGNCAHSDMTTFSFHPVKTITTGEGGAVTTNNADLAERLRRFRHHGLVPGPEGAPWAVSIPTMGFNYRLTDVQAALGTAELAKIDRLLGRRRALADRYDDAFADLDLLTPPDVPGGSASGDWAHARHLYPIRVERRDDLFHTLADAGVGAQVHHVPIHHHPAYAAGLKPSQWMTALPETEAAYAHLLSLPLFPDLTEDEQDHVIATVRRFVEAGG